MSSLFYDDYIDLSNIEKLIKKQVKDKQAREEIFHLIDEIVHHRVVGCLLDRLPQDKHKEFINHISVRPHDKGILNFLASTLVEDVGEFIRFEIHKLSGEILEIIHETSAQKTKKRKTQETKKKK